MWREQEAEQCDSTCQIFSTQHCLLLVQDLWFYCVLKAQPPERVPSGSSGLQRHPEDSHHYPFSMFEFLRMQFCLRNAGNTFHRIMDLVLGELPFCFVFVDDILIFS